VQAGIRVLDRLDALQSSPKRKTTRKVDHEALERVASKGVTAEERKRLRALIEVAKRAAEDAESAAVVEADDGSRDEGLLALYRWYSEWAGTAHAVIKRRDWLILLGLAKRKKKGNPVPPTPPS
jgi:hypothetical protein